MMVAAQDHGLTKTRVVNPLWSAPEITLTARSFSTKFTKRITFGSVLSCWGAALCFLTFDVYGQTAITQAAPARPYEALRYFEIKPGVLSKVLNEFAMKADGEIFYSTDIVQNVQSPGVTGMYSDSEALAKILENTGLKYEKSDEKVFLIHITFTSTDDANGDVNGNTQRVDFSQSNCEVEEIVVTASKRREPIEALAMSVSALRYPELTTREVVSMEDYLSAIPGVNQVDRGVGRNSIVIRGVSANPAFEDPTVGVYFEDVPLTGRAYFGSADLKLVDIEQVEILRGPQGTLYGAGSLAGTVRTIPVDPNLERVEGNIRLGYSQMDGQGSAGHRATGTVNLPLIQDEFAIRASAYRFENSGYIKNVAGSYDAAIALAQEYGLDELAVNGNDIGFSEYRGGRIRALWEPLDHVSITANYVTQELVQHGLPEMRLSLGNFEQSRLMLIDPVGGGEKLGDDFELANVVINYGFGPIELVSSTSVFTEAATRNISLATLFTFPLAHTVSRDTTATIEELRLTSNFDGPVQLLVGLYYEDNHREDNTRFIGATKPVGDMPSLTELKLAVEREVDVEQSALFGDFTLDISDNLNVSLGGRYFHYDIADASDSAGRFIEDGLMSSSTNPSTSESGFNGTASLEFSPSEHSFAYLKYAEGFRLGNAQGLVPTVTCDTNGDRILDGTNVPIDIGGSKSDKVANKELGIKYRSPSGRITARGAVYKNNWRDMPIGVRGSCAVSITINAGKARTYGFEIETSVLISPRAKFDLGVSYIDTELEDAGIALNIEKGNRLSGSPNYSVSAAFQYDFDVVGHEPYVRLDYSRVGGFYENLNEQLPELGNFNLFHLKAGINFSNITTELYIKNVTDTQRLVWVDGLFGYPLKPRTVGLDLTYKF